MAENANNNLNVAVVPVREGSSTTYQCSLLTATNYTSWAIKMESFMDAQGIWDAIEPPVGVDVDVKIGKKARAFIFQALPEDILLQVAGHRGAKDVWDALKVRYLGENRVQQARIQTLNREFELLSMKESDSIHDFASKIGGIASKFRTLGTTMEEKIKVKKLLNAAPVRFLPVVATIEQYSDLNTMPFEELVGRLKAYEERLKPTGSAKDSAGQLLMTKAEWQKADSKQAGRGRGSFPSDSRGRGRGRGRGRHNNRGRGERYPQNSNRKPNQTEQKDKQERRCYNCDKVGHFAADCWAPKKAEGEANLAREDEDHTVLMAACSKELIMLNEENVFPNRYAEDKSDADTWYLDNGASNHMTGNKEYLCELDEKTARKVKFGDGSAVEIKGKGSVLFQGRQGDQRLVTNVYYIPALCNNILSLGQFDEGGCKVVIKDGTLWLFEKTGAVLLKVARSQNRLYKIKLQATTPACYLAKANETAWLWHARLGHLSFDALNTLSTEKMAVGVPLINHKSQLCEACLVGKHRRSAFPTKASYRASQPLELIHADLCGPITPSTSSGNRYFLLLVDDFSRYMWAHIIKSKDKPMKSLLSSKRLPRRKQG
ncbi:hypothetical protein E3N88_21877 [Mikania micrantha]|uniref:CCHC-type domain-containing protein n=1 Tax=Mikania micrantha TaxID=192012 RepID=A0A5N6N8S8_9ASTR|nr:hypothetical protein E3N88_21877 [Mikania micrantha]